MAKSFKKKMDEAHNGAMTLSALIGLLAIAGMIVSFSPQSEPTGAAGSIDRVRVIGQGYGETCLKISQMPQHMIDCCNAMCRPYGTSSNYMPCVQGCQSRLQGTDAFDFLTQITGMSQDTAGVIS